MSRSPETCPNCGADLPRNAKACPECGSDEKTGWSEHARVSGLGLPDDEFDYDDYVAKEFGGKKSPVPHGLHWAWWIVGVVLIIALVFMFVKR